MLLAVQPLALAESASSELHALVERHRYPLAVSGMALSGEGAERLIAEARAADIFMFGENHGIREVAKLAQALYLGSISERPGVLVTEIGPTTAREAERMVRAGEYRDFLAQGINLQSVPFFSMQEEIPLLELAVASNPGRRAVWGLDQEFMASASLLLEVLAAAAETERQRDAVAAARRAAIFNPFLFGMGDGKAVRELGAAFAASGNTDARRLAEHLVLTHRLYSEQMGGDAAWSSERRETLMFENFRDFVAGAGMPLPKLFLKFGGYHLFRHRSPTVKEAALGLRIARWADARGLATVNVYADCAGGEALDALTGRATGCQSMLRDQGAVFEESLYPEGMTLFDLRPLREIAGLDDLHWRLRFLIKGYDFLVLAPGTTASRYADGTLVLHRYGLIAGVFVLAVIALLVWGFIAWRRKRRARLA